MALEAPLQLRARGPGSIAPLAVIMRSPGHDLELATGLALAEGWIEVSAAGGAASRADPAELEPEEEGNVVDLAVTTDPPRERALRSATSCGVCGKTELSQLEVRAAPVTGLSSVSAGVIEALPEALAAGQTLFARTGGVHAAGLFTAAGEALCIREDVGRHNAVDKVVGWAALQGRLPLGESILCVSGRVSFEIAQKAVVAGIPVIAAVSAPTTLAIDVAERFRVTLCGFVRREEFNVYAHPTRIVRG